LSLYTPQPDLFDGIERVVIEEIGTLIGFVIGRAELQKGMFSPTKTELGLSTRDPSARLIQLANSLKTTVTLEYAIPRAGDTFLMSLLFEEELDQEQTRATIEETLKPDKTKVTTTEDGDARWTVVSETCSIKVFIDRGIQLNHIIATPEQCHLYLEAPSNIDSRDIVELAESQFTEVELTEQRTDIERQQSTVSTSDIIADLTPRQLEVLETAYRNGFFQSPRAMGSEEIASLLGISQPAFSRHLRNVQQTVVEHLIEELATSHPLD
jgi:predicted DNA binding protein